MRRSVLPLALVPTLVIIGLASGWFRSAIAAAPSSVGWAVSDDSSEHAPVPVPEPTPTAVRYHQTGLWIWAFARVWDLLVPAAILLSGLSARLRGVARRIGRAWLVTVGLYVVLYLGITYLADLPLRYYAAFVRQHAYGLSNQTLGKWFGDTLKTLAVDATGGLLFAWVPFWLIGRYPRRWWLVLSALTVPFIAFVMLIAPVWIDPLYNDFRPMKNQALEREILNLARRAGIGGGRVFEVNKSVDTKAVNAYVKGLLGTHRIVLWDTLLTKLDDREVLVVMGHEMGHYVLHHVARSIALSTVLLLAGLYWTDRAGRWFVARFGRRFGIEGLADVAATPLLLILIGLSTTVLGPLALAYSRHQEHEADRFALELTRMNRSAARAFVELQRENLGVPHHGLIERIWRATHPSIAERIGFANSYRPWSEGRALRYAEHFAP